MLHFKTLHPSAGIVNTISGNPNPSGNRKPPKWEAKIPIQETPRPPLLGKENRLGSKDIIGKKGPWEVKGPIWEMEFQSPNLSNLSFLIYLIYPTYLSNLANLSNLV